MNHEIPKCLQSSDKEIDYRLRRKTTKATIHYENKTKKNCVNFTPVSGRDLPLQKSIWGGGGIWCPYICTRITA